MNEASIKRLIEQSGKAAASKARADLINDLFQHNEREASVGLATSFPDDLTGHLKSLQRKALSEYQASSAEAYRLEMGLSAVDIAKSAGSINPSLTAEVVVQALKVDRDGSGELYYILKDGHGVACDIPNFIKRMAANPQYGMLFKEGATTGASNEQQSQQKTTTIPATGEVNPWKKETHNLTTQGNILLSDPAKAERLKREAGY